MELGEMFRARVREGRCDEEKLNYLQDTLLLLTQRES